MAAPQNVVTVVINRQSATIQQASFDIPLIFGPSVSFLARTQAFGSSAEAEDVLPANDPLLLAVQAAFAQSPAPQTVKVGRQQVDSVTITPSTVSNLGVYTVTIAAAAFAAITVSFTADASATAAEITAGIVAAIQGNVTLAAFGTATDGTGTYTFANDTPGTAFTITTDTKQTISYADATGRGLNQIAPASSENGANIGVGLSAVEAYDNEWYILHTLDMDATAVQAAATWIASRKKLYLTTSSDANIADVSAASDTTSIAAILNAASQLRTALLYSASPDEFPDVAWSGRMLPTTPGSATFAFKKLLGVTVDNLTTTQIKNITAKNANYFSALGGQNVTRNGKTFGPEWIDVMRDSDWFEARLTERTLGVFINSPKVPFTDKGLGMLEVQLRAQTLEGGASGFLSDDPAPIFTTPLAANVPSNDRANRVLQSPYCLKMQGRLAGAIHETAYDVTIYP